MSKNYKNIIILLLVLIIAFGAFLIVHNYIHHNQDTAWNDGYCVTCGSPWQYLQTVDWKYIYVCPTCDTLLYSYDYRGGASKTFRRLVELE